MLFNLIIYVLSPVPYPTSSPPQIIRQNLSENECETLRRGLADVLRPEIWTGKDGVIYIRCEIIYVR